VSSLPQNAERSVGAAAALVAGLALLLYRSTLLPGFDFGDSASFQTMAGSIDLTPRDGYPLYYAVASVFAWLVGDPARAMNLASAVAAALACGLLVMVAFELSGSLPAAIAAALFFGGSYTFWSQSILAEVYALHILLVLLTLLLLLAWQRDPAFRRLSLFLAVYALAFGNHLSMILLAPAFVCFLVQAAPDGWRQLFRWQTVAVAAAFAAAGACQYLWNLRALWVAPVPPAGLLDGLATFWFDVTKSDWRETMVLQVPGVMAVERLKMYAFDVRQQFGSLPIVAAVAGAVYLWRVNRPRAFLLLLIWLVTVAFAFGYNVGDAYVFLLPSHLALALLMAPGIVAIGGLGGRARLQPTLVLGAGAAMIALAGFRIYSEYPALDRSGDTRPTQTLQALTAGIDERNSVLLTDLNWQIQNGLTYFGNYVRPEVAYIRLPEVALYAPALIRDNFEIGRTVTATQRAADWLRAAYGPLYDVRPDSRAPGPGIAELTRDLPNGTRWVLCALRPTREFPLDVDDVRSAMSHLMGRNDLPIGLDDYAVAAGVVGQPVVLARTASTPFKVSVDLEGLRVDVRMDSWLAFDTIRRMGFGHVITGRTHALIVERGISFAALDERGRVLRSGYAAGIYAPQPRFLVSPATARDVR
jgi:hypothetical protein